MAWAWLERTAFTRVHRISVWMLCADLLESGFEIEHVLPVVAEVNRSAGRKSVGRVIEGLIPALEAGRFREAVARVTPSAEAMVFEGFGRSDPVEVFRAAARIAEVGDRVAVALRAHLAGPIFLTLVAGGLVYGAGVGFVPVLEGLAPVETWPVASQLAANLAVGFADNVVWFAVAFVALAVAFAWLARNWTGKGRSGADEVVPFSLVAPGDGVVIHSGGRRVDARGSRSGQAVVRGPGAWQHALCEQPNHGDRGWHGARGTTRTVDGSGGARVSGTGADPGGRGA